MTSKKLILLIFIIGLITYFNALFNDFVWDDFGQVVANPDIHFLRNLPKIFGGSTFYIGGFDTSIGEGKNLHQYYRPMMGVTFAAIYNIFGSNPFYFHLIQIILHVVNAILLFIIFKRFLSKNISTILSLIFLVHPINVEAVSYIGSIYNNLGLFFILSTLVLINKSSVYTLVLLNILFLFGLLSLEVVLIYLLLIPLYFVLIEKVAFPKALVKSSAITVCPLIVYLFLRITIAHNYFSSSGILVPITEASLFERIITIPKIIFFYIQNFFYPKNLAISQNWVVRSVTLEDFYLPLVFDSLFFLFLFLSGIFLYKKSKPNFKIFLFFFTWFVLTLGIFLQIIPLDMTVAERWFYFPSIGLIGMLSLIFQTIIRKKPNLKPVMLVISILLVLSFTVRTIIRNANWKNNTILYSHDIKYSDESPILHSNYGVVLARNGQLPEAKKHFEISIKLAPYSFVTYANLGAIYEAEGNTEQAIKYYGKSIEISPGFYGAYINLANTLYKLDPLKAKQFTQDALIIFPQNPHLWLILALTEYKLNNTEAALQAAAQSYKIQPSEKSASIINRLKQNLP